MKNNFNTIITFSNGEEFVIPNLYLAEDRANYYACKVDGYKPHSPEWQEEVEFALINYDEIREWVANNMNWEDIEPHGNFIRTKSIDYDADFSNASIEVN